MKKIKYYDQFIVESNYEFNRKLTYALYEALSPEDKQHLSLEEVIKSSLNEGFIKTISDKGKALLQRIANISHTINEFLDKVGKELANNLGGRLFDIKDKMKVNFEEDNKVVKIIKGKMKTDKIALLHDVKTCKSVYDFYTKDFTKSIINMIISNFQKIFLHKEVSESLLNEGIKLSIVDHAIEILKEKPPLSWFDKINVIATRGADHLIKFLSHITQKLGGPEFVLPIITVIMGLIIESVTTEKIIMAGILKTAEMIAFPFVGIIIEFITHVTTILAIYELCSEILLEDDEVEKIGNKYKIRTKSNESEAGSQKMEEAV